jgi:hypothetical protein
MSEPLFGLKVYRRGWGPLYRRTIRQMLARWGNGDPLVIRRSPTWRRFAAEWDGCPRLVLGWTEAGCRRKALHRIMAENTAPDYPPDVGATDATDQEDHDE